MIGKSFACLALAAAVLGAADAPTGAAFNTVRIRNDVHSSGFHASATLLDWNIDRGGHLAEIRTAIEENKPDLCILQEVDLDARRTHGEDVARELADAFHMNYAFATEFEELSQGTRDEPAYHGQALLTRLPIRSSRILRFSHQSGFWKPRPLLISALPILQRREGGRIALVTELDNGGAPLVVYDLHLESRGNEHLRLLQLEEVLADAKRYPQDTPLIVAGDLNTKSRHSQLIACLRQAGYRSSFGDRRIRTHILIGALDWVFLRGPIECQGAQVLRSVHGSDHFPITVQVHLPGT